MTFDNHWTKVLSFNPALAENPFLRPLAEAAWNAAAVAEREACANICDHEHGTAGDAADKIRMRSNTDLMAEDWDIVQQLTKENHQ